MIDGYVQALIDRYTRKARLSLGGERTVYLEIVSDLNGLESYMNDTKPKTHESPKQVKQGIMSFAGNSKDFMKVMHDLIEKAE